ncbi:MAG TPA: TraR/DksA C4-type zinc finger protein [Vicinamibacterales bacterium]|nr:TraR/DksA C4-type zinc finger protein [Vicinamibacterales bacterium]
MQPFKQRLLELETSLSDRVARKRGDALAQTLRGPGDVADASVADEGEGQSFAEADVDAAQLQQVRDALRRIADGTFGRCVVDGKPIEPKRLEAQPWTPYCLEHEQRRERGSRRPPTL